MLLEIEGYQVIGEAPDGMTALARVRELDPDVVLLDVNLPDIDGFEVAGRLRKGSGRPPVGPGSEGGPAGLAPARGPRRSCCARVATRRTSARSSRAAARAGSSPRPTSRAPASPP